MANVYSWREREKDIEKGGLGTPSSRKAQLVEKHVFVLQKRTFNPTERGDG